jgi:hypothetical protein
MDDRVIKAALDSFENDDFLKAKELVQGQVKQAKNDFLKGKLGLKNDIEQQFTNVEAGTNITDIIEPAEKSFARDEEPEEPEETPKPKKKLLTRKKK